MGVSKRKHRAEHTRNWTKFGRQKKKERVGTGREKKLVPRGSGKIGRSGNRPREILERLPKSRGTTMPIKRKKAGRKGSFATDYLRRHRTGKLRVVKRATNRGEE